MARSCLALFVFFILSIQSAYSSGDVEDRSCWSKLTEGYHTAYDTFYPLAYEQGYGSGLIEGAQSGYKKGLEDGLQEIYGPYEDFEYGVNISDFSDKKLVLPAELETQREGSKWFDFGYAAGKKAATYTGYAKGFLKGRKKAHGESYQKGLRHGKFEASKELFYNHTSEGLTDIQQLDLSIDYIQIGKLDFARNHLNVIIRDMYTSEYRKDALFHAGRVHEMMKDQENALKCYLMFLESNEAHPEYYKVAIRAARILKDLKTDGFMMIGRRTYFRYACFLARNIIQDTDLLELVPEACFIAGECYGNMHEDNLAKEMFARIVSDFPASPFFEKAKKKLKKL